MVIKHLQFSLIFQEHDSTFSLEGERIGRMLDRCGSLNSKDCVNPVDGVDSGTGIILPHLLGSNFVLRYLKLSNLSSTILNASSVLSLSEMPFEHTYLFLESIDKLIKRIYDFVTRAKRYY
uniref:Uncharacterized protein n=1 Tax=Schistocephalus solidus TaxID=70667 RepID=A0A0X3PUV9_SCHSO